MFTLWPMRVDEGHDQPEARLQRVDKLAETLNRVVKTLRHHADRPQQIEDNNRKQDDGENTCTFWHGQLP